MSMNSCTSHILLFLAQNFIFRVQLQSNRLPMVQVCDSLIRSGQNQASTGHAATLALTKGVRSIYDFV
ncbi:unnamed protein product [Sympodiomycopsis kandeliae]